MVRGDDGTHERILDKRERKTMSWTTILGLWAASFASPTQAPQEALGFNVDIGEADRTAPEVGGEAHQPGYWNGVGYTRQARWSLRDLAGQVTAVSLSIEGASSWVQCRDGERLGALLRDGVHADGEDLRVVLHDLPAGTYLLLVYGKPHCQAQDTSIGVEGAQGLVACLTLDAMGHEPESVAFRVMVQDGSLVFWLRPAGPGAEARLAGFQLVPFGSSGGAGARLLFEHEGVRAALRCDVAGPRWQSLSKGEGAQALWAWGPIDPNAPPLANGWGWESGLLPIAAPEISANRPSLAGWHAGASLALVGQTVWGRLRVRTAGTLWVDGRTQRWQFP